MEQFNKQDAGKVILQVNQKRASDSEIDLINVFSYMGKKKRLIAYLLALAIVVGASFGALYSGFEHFTGKGSYVRAMITFQFEGIDKGLDPNGAAFDVNQIKSPYVIQKALSELGIDDSYIEKARENIVIQGVVPEDAVERITAINNMASEDAKYCEKLLDVSYFPSQYLVFLYDDGTFTQRELPQILNGIIQSYKQYFLDTYANTEVLTVTSNLLSGDDYDYGESVDLVKTQIDIMMSYARERMNDAPDFRASSTGLSFQDIVTALEFVKTVDISRLSSYVESQSLTKDKSRQSEYYDYMIRECSNKLSELQTNLETINSAINSYEKDPVVIVSGADSTLEYGEKSEYYDNLVNQRLSITKQIAQTNTDLNEYYLLQSKLSESDRANTDEEFDYADGLLSKIENTISSWVKLIEETTDEYYNTTLFSNAVTVAVPAQYFVDGGIVHIAKNVAIPAVVLVVIVLMWWFFNGVKMEIAFMRQKSSKEKKQRSSEPIIL